MIKKFEQFSEDVNDPYNEEIWEDDATSLDEYRDIAIKLDLNPTEFWRMDPDLNIEGFSFLFDGLFYDVTFCDEYGFDGFTMSVVNRDTVYPKSYNEEIIKDKELHGNTEKSFLDTVKELADMAKKI